MFKINTRPFGGIYADVTIELGPPHNTVIYVGSFEKDALNRLAQEVEHDLDWLQNTANNLKGGE